MFTSVGPHRYLLTFCTRDRKALFRDHEAVALIRDHFLRAAREAGFEVIAYCFMPDHVHLLVEGRHDDADLRRFVKRAKQYSAFYFTRRTGIPLWQRYGYERVLRQEESTPTVIEYIVNNPVRAGLVTSPVDYPFWGSSVYSREQLMEYVQGRRRGRLAPAGRLKAAPTSGRPLRGGPYVALTGRGADVWHGVGLNFESSPSSRKCVLV